MQDFHNLDIWKRSHALSLRIYALVEAFPRRGTAELRDQLTRSARSIPTNIVEGCGAATNKEFARFLDMSIKSTTETEYHVLTARDRGFISEELFRELTGEVIEIRRMIYGFRRRLRDDK